MIHAAARRARPLRQLQRFVRSQLAKLDYRGYGRDSPSKYPPMKNGTPFIARLKSSALM